MASSLDPHAQEVINLLRQGVPNTEIGRQYGVSEAAVRRFANRHREELENYSLDDLPSEEEILRVRNRELERVAKQSRDFDLREEFWMRRLERAIPVLQPKYKPAKIERSGGKQGHEFALLFSDTHAGEVVRPGETLGMNEYNWDIMLRRMNRLQQSVLSFQQHRPYPIRKLHVWMLGDMLSGSIHDELANTNEFSDAEAVVQFAYDTAAWIEEFVPHFEEIQICGVPGNHPRRSKKIPAKQAFNNDDWLMYQMVALLLRDHPSISFNLPKSSFCATTVAERWRMLLLHGDGIRSTMPGVPWGGVVRRITTLQQQFNAAKQPIDYVALGHFHTANMLEGVGVKTFINGSVKGLDEYSLKAFGSGKHPSQLLLTFHPDHGATDVSWLDLEDVLPAAA